MLNPELLAILVCPATHQDVSLASAGEIAQLNDAIGRGQMRTVGGEVVDRPVEGALIRADRAVAYPVRDDIPVMLVADALDLAKVPLVSHA
jgi:uncharacterized protein YbaR (Trm112 family)